MTLLTRAEIEALTLAEEHAAAQVAARRLRSRPALQRAVLLIQPPPDVHRERVLRLLMAHAEVEQYQVTDLTSDSAAVLALAADHLVDVVLVAANWRGSHLEEIEAAAPLLGVRVVVLRRPPDHGERHRVNVDPIVTRMLALGFPAEVIAEVIAAPVERVAEALARARPERSARTSRPVHRHR